MPRAIPPDIKEGEVFQSFSRRGDSIFSRHTCAYSVDWAWNRKFDVTLARATFVLVSTISSLSRTTSKEKDADVRPA